MDKRLIFDDFLKALGQIGDPKFRSVLLRGLGLTVALLAAFYAVFVFVLQLFLPETMTLPWLGEVDFVSNLLSGVAILGMLVLSVFLMVPVASACTGFFLDDVAAAVEAKHYPGLPPVPRVPLGDTLRDSLRFLGLMIVVNLLALIVYLISTVFAPFVFWMVNGFLLGREYFQMVAIRRLGLAEADALRRKHTLAIWVAGTLMAVPLSFPVINLLVPILGAATFTHLFHRLQRKS